MNREWIRKCGNSNSGQLHSAIDSIIEELNTGKYFAMYTDRFESGNVSKGCDLDPEYLLEARLFDDNRELLVTRGSIGEDFNWRYIADEEKYDDHGVIHKYADDPSDELIWSAYASYQAIDMDPAESRMDPESGSMSILSTVKGRYSLPIDEEKRIKIVTYVKYDSNGMAYVCDNRVCGFVK